MAAGGRRFYVGRRAGEGDRFEYFLTGGMWGEGSAGAVALQARVRCQQPINKANV